MLNILLSANCSKSTPSVFLPFLKKKTVVMTPNKLKSIDLRFISARHYSMLMMSYE